MKGDRWQTSKTDNFRSQQWRDIKTEWWGRQWLWERDDIKWVGKGRTGLALSRTPLTYDALLKLAPFCVCAVHGGMVGGGGLA